MSGNSNGAGAPAADDKKPGKRIEKSSSQQDAAARLVEEEGLHRSGARSRQGGRHVWLDPQQATIDITCEPINQFAYAELESESGLLPHQHAQRLASATRAAAASSAAWE